MASIWGSLGGNISGTIYFLYFQLIGLLIAGTLLSQKNTVTRLLCGSVLGSVLLQWIPALFAFLLDFSAAAHIAAALFSGVIAVVLLFIK